MSILFKQISYKNFLSTGNIPNTVNLSNYNSTLITGNNGEGKSTIIEALTFSLFGKPYRNITKPQLVNSINQKNCLVEIEFNTNNHDYIVKRGIKPNIFEIYCDGIKLNQDASTRDYQKVLEQQILKLNFKTFTQVVILGSVTFIPFMQLPAMQRREIIEDILDIKIFSLMNQILKEKTQQNKEEIDQINRSLNDNKIKIIAQQKLIGTLESNRQANIDNIQQLINSNNEQIRESQQRIDELNVNVDKIKGKADNEQLKTVINSANQMKIKLSTRINSFKQNISFFNDNTICPVCTQEIFHDHKVLVLRDIENQLEEQVNKYNNVTDALSKLEKKLSDTEKYADELRDIIIEISTISHKINILTGYNTDLHNELQKVDNNSGNILEEQQKLKDLNNSTLDFLIKKGELLELRNLSDIAGNLLKDTGIKTAIIREYLPKMNYFINKYLNLMDFFVRFELDESFHEVIKSRDRDIFTYESFSEGEKQKVDLALMFAWRQIAKMKNSVSTNLLIMDEIFDSSLDAAGSESLLTLLEEHANNTNIFIISHRDVVAGANFQNTIRAKKVGDFSILVDASE